MVEQKPLSQKVIITNSHGLDFDPESSTHQLPKDIPRPDFEFSKENEQQLMEDGGRAIQLLLDDHSLVNSLYQDEFVNMNENRSEQKLLLTRMIKEMTVHLFIEEAIIHPLLVLFVKMRQPKVSKVEAELMSYSKREELVNLLRHENHLLMVDMQQLLNMDPEDAQFIPMVNNMIQSWRRHIEIQEGPTDNIGSDSSSSRSDKSSSTGNSPSLLLTYLNKVLNNEQKELLFYALTDARTIAPHVPLSVNGSDWLSGPNAEAWERLKRTFEL